MFVQRQKWKKRKAKENCQCIWNAMESFDMRNIQSGIGHSKSHLFMKMSKGCILTVLFHTTSFFLH